ncbi:MAG: DUF192 domain-containing protein [Lysobacter sp.]
MDYARRITLALLASYLLAGCASGQDRWVELQGSRYRVEVAADQASRAQGLMYRDSLAEGHGMLFIHDREEPQAYWMKNTRIPLDILYFDNQRRLVSQQRGVPPCSAGDRCPPYPSGAPARFVLELNAGQAAQMGLRDGAMLELSPSIPAPGGDAGR